ncbi:putative nuclease HARBI1 isoform X2 [Tanacetum coccineum]
MPDVSPLVLDMVVGVHLNMVKCFKASYLPHRKMPQACFFFVSAYFGQFHRPVSFSILTRIAVAAKIAGILARPEPYTWRSTPLPLHTVVTLNFFVLRGGKVSYKVVQRLEAVVFKASKVTEMGCKTEKTLKFKRIQESSRKDIERAFGVLQGRWGIIRQPARAFEINALKRIMYCCVMLHNMILEDEDFVVNLRDVFVDPTPDIPQEWTERCDLHVRKHKELRDSKVHNDLRDDLVYCIF